MYGITEGIKEIMENEYRCFKYCKKCEFRRDKHYANCIECCPVRNGKIKNK